VNETILSVDTTHEFGSLALMRGDEVVEEMLLHSPDGFGHVLYGHLSRLLDRHGARVCEVDCFATACGPGSFTGVRVGLACVKGLAEACGKPVVAVGNLRAIASSGMLPLRAAVLDARRGEIYGAVYDAAGAVIVPETVAKFPAWIASLPEAEMEFLSTDFSPFRAALEATRFAGALVTTVPRALAAAIARIALAEFRAGRANDPAAVDADYVRRSDAELLWKDR
jgi:tRNA threonylcarbamoyladenosine biosynthesis protein TsaB